MIEFIQKVKNPKYLVITPLRLGDEPYKELMESIWVNTLPFDWITYCGPYNIPKNTQEGLLEYCKHHKKPKYFIKVDNDIMFKEATLDKMFAILDKSPKNVAYAYSGFAFKGSLNMRFGHDKFDPKRLMQSNYISSVSMIKTAPFEKVGGFIIDDKYIRLLDYCMWLHFLRYGYIGTPVESYFEAIVDKPGISNGSAEDYHKKLSLVREKFVKPLIGRF